MGWKCHSYWVFGFEKSGYNPVVIIHIAQCMFFYLREFVHICLWSLENMAVEHYQQIVICSCQSALLITLRKWTWTNDRVDGPVHWQWHLTCIVRLEFSWCFELDVCAVQEQKFVWLSVNFRRLSLTIKLR